MRERLINSRFFDMAGLDGCAVAAGSGGIYGLRLGGRFPPGWCGHLSRALSRQGISIVRGFAKRVVPDLWIAELQIKPIATGPDPATIDYLSLATLPSESGQPVAITLDSYFVDASPESGEFLFLEVQGPDCLGFLGSLLEHLAVLSLFPEQISIETWQGWAFDCFHLKAAGRRSPPEEMGRALAEMLEGLRAPLSAAR